MGDGGHGRKYLAMRRKQRFKRLVNKYGGASFWWQGKWHTPRPYLTPPRREGSHGSYRGRGNPVPVPRSVYRTPINRGTAGNQLSETPDEEKDEGMVGPFITAYNTRPKRGKTPQKLEGHEIKDLGRYLLNYCLAEKKAKKPPSFCEYGPGGWRCIILDLCSGKYPGDLNIPEGYVRKAFRKLYL